MVDRNELISFISQKAEIDRSKAELLLNDAIREFVSPEVAKKSPEEAYTALS